MNNDNTQIMRQIMDEIKSYQRIIIVRHQRPDGDAMGSTLGLREILRLTYPEKEIYSIGQDSSEYMAFLGDDDEDLPEEAYADALIIAIDTATTDRLANRNYSLGKRLIKIDHHIDVLPFGDISWVEDWRSSACEMIAYFYYTFRDELKINSCAATCIYAGIVTDSGRFRFGSATGDTMRYSALLLDCGIDTEKLFADLYLESFDYYKFQSFVFGQMRITPNGVVYLHVDKAMQKRFNLTAEQASNSVSFMNSIKGSPIWLAFIDNADGTIRVRLRSRFVTVDELANKYHGGGHACASGATVYSAKEMKALIDDADRLLAEFKKTHEDVK